MYKQIQLFLYLTFGMQLTNMSGQHGLLQILLDEKET